MAKSIQEQTEEYATAVGYALHAWSSVEAALGLLFEELSGMSPARKADAAFFSIKSFETRLDVCHALMSFAEQSESDIAVWNLLYECLKKYHRKRHRLAHFTIIETTTVSRGKRTKSVSLVPFWPAQKPKNSKLTLKEINERAEKFSALQDAVRWFWLIEKSRQAPHGEPRPPAPDLVRRLHLKAARTRAERKPQTQSSRK